MLKPLDLTIAAILSTVCFVASKITRHSVLHGMKIVLMDEMKVNFYSVKLHDCSIDVRDTVQHRVGQRIRGSRTRDSGVR